VSPGPAGGAVHTPVLHVASDAAGAATAAARHVAVFIERTVSERGRCRVALAGGSTPGALYERLAQPELLHGSAWSCVELFWSDERCTPIDDPRSNYRLAADTLLVPRAAAPAAVHRIAGELGPVLAAAAYARALGSEPLDIVLLGMGEDGHTASLFPSGPELDEQEARVVASVAPVAPHDRVTMSLAALNEARHVCFLVVGAGKAARVAEVLAQLPGSAPTLPAARVRSGGELHWFLDAAAARYL
jgi:6-phosphogluconolactonase